MANTTPVWTANVSVIPATTLSFGNTLRGTIDLNGKYGAMIFVRLGRKSTGAPSTAITVEIRRLIDNDTAGDASPITSVPFSTSAGAGQASTVNADSAAGQPQLLVASTVSFGSGDRVTVFDAAYSRLEFHKISKIVAGALVMDRPLQFAHTAAQADSVAKMADCFAPTWLYGGALWEVVVDYGAATSGSDYVVQVKAQTYDSDASI